MPMMIYDDDNDVDDVNDDDGVGPSILSLYRDAESAYWVLLHISQSSAVSF